jgi:hypothetical protein
LIGRKILKKMSLQRNKIWAAVFQLLGALNLPPAQARCFAPRRPSLRGAFFAHAGSLSVPARLADIGRRSRLAATRRRAG